MRFSRKAPRQPRPRSHEAHSLTEVLRQRALRGAAGGAQRRQYDPPPDHAETRQSFC